MYTASRSSVSAAPSGSAARRRTPQQPPGGHDRRSPARPTRACRRWTTSRTAAMKCESGSASATQCRICGNDVRREEGAREEAARQVDGVDDRGDALGRADERRHGDAQRRERRAPSSIAKRSEKPRLGTGRRRRPPSTNRIERLERADEDERREERRQVVQRRQRRRRGAASAFPTRGGCTSMIARPANVVDATP